MDTQFYSNEMPLIHSLNKKLTQDGTLASASIMKQSTWKAFHHAIRGKKLVLYGTGDMFDYFCSTYLDSYEVAFAINGCMRPGSSSEKKGIPVFPLEKLQEIREPFVVLITLINKIDEIAESLSSFGVQEYFSLPVMEYHRMSIRTKVNLAHIWKPYTRSYQLYWKVRQLENQFQRELNQQKGRIDQQAQKITQQAQRITQQAQRITQQAQRITQQAQRINRQEQRLHELQIRQTERYRYLLHTNWVLNVLIDQCGDEELKKEQMRYLFRHIHKNTYDPDLENPRSFNEKLLAMQLYDHNPLYTRITDKLEFKKYIAEQVGEDYVVPLLGVWDRPEDIDFSQLPDQFVLKSTCGGDGKKVIIVKDKASMNTGEIMQKMRSWVTKYSNDYYYNFNWPFKGNKQKIIAEELLDIEGLPYYDFKVHCFCGEPIYINVMTYSTPEKTKTYFDLNWERQTFKHHLSPFSDNIPKPDCLEEMLSLSRKLSAPFNYVRVDFYVLKDRLYLGELTLTPAGGLGPFDPVDVDFEWGGLMG